MGTPSRSSQFSQLHKILKKHYRPAAPDPQRSVLEHLLFGSLLENASYEATEESFAALVHTFFDWNEVRVTSVSELAESMARLPDPRDAAGRVKRILHGVFEAQFSFDLEELRKRNLGPAVKWLEKIDGTNDFSVAYVTQVALGGHRIPIDPGAFQALWVVDLISEKDRDKHVVPGLERAVAKSKGVEMGSLIHRLGVDFTANPYSPKLKKILLEINPDCQDRLPKRRAAKKSSEEKADADRKARKAKAADGESKNKTSKSGSKSRKASDAKGKAKSTKAAKKKTTSKKLAKRKPR